MLSCRVNTCGVRVRAPVSRHRLRIYLCCPRACLWPVAVLRGVRCVQWACARPHHAIPATYSLRCASTAIVYTASCMQPKQKKKHTTDNKPIPNRDDHRIIFNQYTYAYIIT